MLNFLRGRFSYRAANFLTLWTLFLLCLVRPVTAATLVTNGGFELPNIPSGSFIVSNAIPGWTRDAALSVGTGIELQDNAAGAPYAGQNLCELDSDGVTAIYQDLSTVNGQVYRLRFAFSPRPGVAQNIMRVFWGGSLVTTVSVNGSALGATSWQLYTFYVTAAGATTRLRFDNLTETSDSLGSYLDGVEVVDIPEPGPVTLLISGLTVGCILQQRRRYIASKTRKNTEEKKKSL